MPNQSHSEPSPLYQQVKDYILSMIQSGEWPTRSKIPSENELVEKMSVSRMTVNRALRELTASGYLFRLQGVGTFVAPARPLSTLLEIKPIADEIKDRGGNHTCKIILAESEPATSDLALTMALPAGYLVFHILIVHMDNEKPVQLEDRYVNPASAPDFLNQDFTKITPSRYLLDIAPYSEVEHILEAIIPDNKTRELLEMEIGEPGLVLYRRTWSGNTVITRSRFTHPGSRNRLGGRFQPGSINRPEP